jgi:prepilin peptidase CpaA
MILLILFLICIFVTCGIGVLAGLSDIRTLTIPNVYCVAVCGLFLFIYGVLALWGMSGQVFGTLTSHLLSAGLTFVVTFAMFGLRMIGAGDSKFASVCALWFSLSNLPVFLFLMALGGAGLGVAALYIRQNKPFKEAVPTGWVGQVQAGASKVPYGVAISFGMVIAFLFAGYLSSDVMSLFLAPGDVSPAS